MKCLSEKFKNFIHKFKDKNFARGFSTVVGTCVLNFLIGAIFSLCTLAVYEISYINAKGGDISIEHLTFYYPIELFFQCIAAFMSGIIYKIVGLHITNLIGVTMLIIGYFLMYLSGSLASDIFAMILGGIGTGIIYYPSSTNSFEWFKENNGLISGIVETVISLGSFFFAFIGEKIINPDELPSNDEDSLYSLEISKNVKLYLLIQIICLVLAFVISFFTMFEKKNYNDDIDIDIQNESDIMGDKGKNDDDEKTKDEKNMNINLEEEEEEEEDQKKKYKKHSDNEVVNENEKIKHEKEDKGEKEDDDYDDKKTKKEDNKFKGDNNKKEKLLNNDNKIYEDEKEEKIEQEKEDKIDDKGEKLLDKAKKIIKTDIQRFKDILKVAIKSKRLILFSVILILQSPVANMAFSLYREIGEHKKVDVKYLQLIGSLYFIVECLSSFVFGILCDYIPLKYLLLFINIVSTIIGFTYCLTFENGLVFFLVQNLLSFCGGGYYPVKDVYLMKIFGEGTYIELSGLVSFVVSIMINLLTPITYFVLSGFEDKDNAYWILFITFGVLNLIGCVLNFFLKETPIDLYAEVKDETEELEHDEKE